MNNNSNNDGQVDEALEEETTVVDGRIDDLEQKVGDLENKYKRALADYQNLEKRVQEQRSDWIRVSNRELLLRLLPVLDTLVMASQHSDDQSLKVSITLFLDALKGEGVTRVETVGKAFDPNTMEAIGTKDGDGGKVVEEARAGYMMHDKLLRAAQVVVGKKKE